MAGSNERRAIVIGGSIAGLFVGAFLRRIGWRVDIYERSPIELIGRGVGIFATHLELFEALDKCGAGTVDIGVIVYKRITFDREGHTIAEKPQLQIVTSWDRLRQVLLRAIDRQHYYFGHAFQRLEQDGTGVQVFFANGRSERADLLVACDGFRSSVRAQLVPDIQPVYSGYYIWRGAPNESDLSPDTRRTMFPYYSFYLGDQLQALGYPISGADDELRAGHRRYNWGWYRLADAVALKQMCTDDTGCEYEFGVPPPLVRARTWSRRCVLRSKTCFHPNTSIALSTSTSRFSHRFMMYALPAWSTAVWLSWAMQPRRRGRTWASAYRRRGQKRRLW